MNLGIDFGSTYSSIAKYNPITDAAEALTLAEGAPASVPSVVSISKKGVITCGLGAKEQVGKKSVRIFEAFKMLLNESNQEMLHRRGYDDQYTPQYITKTFLEAMLRGGLHREGKSSLDNVVICVPEIWSKKLNTLDGRAILRNILKKEIDIPVNHVQVVTEPEAASAFIAYNYEKETKKNFNGHLLLIDYGGGTLDLTLTQVVSTGNGSMEISYREGGGAGENHPDNRGGGAIGKAGIAYMQGVVLRALQDRGLVDEENAVDYTNPEFFAAVKDLESQMKSAERIKDIEDVFGEFGAYRHIKKILDEDPVDFVSVEYDGEEVTVTYQHLFEAYRDIIERVLQDEISKINQLVKGHIGEDPCQPAAGMRDNFKIAMVGGFCSYYLVKKQIAEIYNLDPNSQIDLRVKNVSADKQEQAISLGAALLAAGKVVQKKTARYSIGIYTTDYDGRGRLFYGIKYHQTVEEGRPYFLCFDDQKPDVPQNRVTYGGLSGNIKTFAIEFSEHKKRGGLMQLKPEMLQRLQQLPEEGFWNLGFSMDKSDVISFHIVPRPMPGMEHQGKEIVIQLDSYSRMFDLTAAKEVTT